VKALAQRQLLEVSRTDWETPQPFFDALDVEFHFTLDVCASQSNAKCERYITIEQDALREKWCGETCWMNPPYGREIARWVHKGYWESRICSPKTTVVGLVPARTDTAWWHDWVQDKAEVRFVRGRLKFGKLGRQSAPFPSAVVIWRPEETV
jgi:phage N-6-adenine-methyltransferase